MFCVGPNRKRKSPDKIDGLRAEERPAVPGGPAASPSGVLGNPFKSMRLSPIPRNNGEHSTPRKKYSTGTASSSSDDMAGFGAFPMVGMIEKDALWSGDAATRHYQPYKGQLKLSVYINCGHLTVHVVQARHLSSKFKRICDTYVKVSLAPEDSSRPQWKTETIYDTNKPLFDEKFSLELVDGDLKKRLLISAWCRDAGGKGATEFLGCMSFGVRGIYSETKSVSGWYYLLADEVGRRKHLQVVTRKAALHDKPPAVIPKVNQDLKFMDPHLLVLKKSKHGYGFTVSGSCPVKVCRVDPGSPAEAAGLKPDDCIVRIDGLNVSRSTSDSVARIIKHTGKQLVLEVQRVNTVPKMASSPWKPMSMSTPRYQPGQQPPNKRKFGTNLPPMQQLNTEPQLHKYQDCKDSIIGMPPFLSSMTPITGNLQNRRANPTFAHRPSHQQSDVLGSSDGYPPFYDFLTENIENTPMVPSHAAMRKRTDNIENIPMLPKDVWQAYRLQCQNDQMHLGEEQFYNYYQIDEPVQHIHYRQPRQTGKRVTFKELH